MKKNKFSSVFGIALGKKVIQIFSEKETLQSKPRGGVGFNQEECSREDIQAEETSTPSSSAQTFKFHQQIQQSSGVIIVTLCF